MCPRGGKLFGGDGGPLTEVPIVAHCLLIEAGSDLVLVDTGFGTGDIADPKRLGQPFRSLVRPSLIASEPAVRQVEALGLDPKDVRHIIATHLDVDHAGGLGDFPDAEVHVFGPELDMALNPTWRERQRYIQPQWAHGPQWRRYAIGGDDWFGFESVRLLEGLGAEIAIIPLVGHSAGSVGIAVNRPEGWLLHCGDAYFSEHDLEDPPTTAGGIRFFQTLVQFDGKKRHANQQRLRDLKRDHGSEVTLMCSHEPREFEELSAENAN